MKRRYRLLFGTVCVIGYLLLLPREIPPSLTLKPVASYKLGDDTLSQPSPPVPFATPRFVGFLNADGSPRISEPVRYGATAAGVGFINYDSISQNLLIRDDQGGMIAPVDTRGYPFFVGTRLMILSTDRLRLKEYGLDGELLWQRSFRSLITVCTGSGERLLVGMLNGDYVILDGEGMDLHRFSPEVGRISVAYGAGIDGSAGSYLVVTGADPQGAVLYEERAGELRQIHQFELGSDIRRDLMVKLPLPGLFAVEQQDELLLFDESTFKERRVPLPGRLTGIRGFAEEELLIVLSHNDEGRYLALLGAYSDYRGELPVPADAPGASIELVGNRLFLILDDRVAVYLMERV